MDLHAGRKAASTVELQCKECPFVVMVARGDKIPPCPCGGKDYEKLEKKAPARRTRPRLKLKKVA